MKTQGFSSTAFPPQYLPGTNFFSGIKNSCLGEPSGTRKKTTVVENVFTTLKKYATSSSLLHFLVFLSSLIQPKDNTAVQYLYL